MKSRILKRSIVVGGHKTSVSLENEFWRGLKEIAMEREKTLSSLVAEIGAARVRRNLSSALRIFVLEHYQAEASRQRTNTANAARATVDQARERDAEATPENTCTTKS
jgi:predicted DNA-binding ribbon-helix-helix protein